MTEAKREVARVFDAAVAAHKAGHFADAETGYRRVLEVVPHEAEPNYLLGMVLLSTNQLDHAVTAFNTCLKSNPDHAQALNGIGTAYSKLKRHDEAMTSLSRATELNDRDVQAWFNLGLARIEAKQFESALTAFEQTLSLDAKKWDAMNGAGLSLLELGRIEDSIEMLLRCIENAPELEAAHINLIRSLIKHEQFDDALSKSEEAIDKWPKTPLFHVLAASAFKSQGDTDAALERLQWALSIDPDCTTALNHLAGYLNELGLWKKAEEPARRSLALDPHDAGMLTLMGRLRQMRGDLPGAQVFYNKAIDADPTYGEAYNNLGNTLNYMDQGDAALSAFATAASLKPESEGVRLNRAIAQMTLGDIYPACKDYRFRFNVKESRNVYRNWSFPEWNGEPLTGKKLLLWTDQGVGDEVLFSRYASKFIADSAYGVLECGSRLLRLFKRSFPDINIVAQTTPPDPELASNKFDYHGALIDVCCAHFHNPTMIPAARPLIPDPTLTKALRGKYLGLSNGKPLVGISWRSGGSDTSHFKSTQLCEWLDILANPDVTFINLQYGDVGEEIETMNAKLDEQVFSDVSIDSSLDLDPFAAQVAAMDLVITTSNATAHFAGALGKEVWNLLPTGPGRLWYWFNQGMTTPWYDTMTLYRHRHNEGWSGVLEQVRDRLQNESSRLQSGSD